jgi:hypothetical protein
MTRIVGNNAAIQAAIQQRQAYQPRSQIIGPPAFLLTPPVVVPVAYMIEGEPGWHLPADHDDPIELLTEGAVVGLFLVVVFVGMWRAVIRLVQHPLRPS